jgi:hypothetical protein
MTIVLCSDPDKHKKLPAMNKPCPCGSGKKFKKCHFRNIVDQKAEAIREYRGRYYDKPTEEPTGSVSDTVADCIANSASVSDGK